MIHNKKFPESRDIRVKRTDSAPPDEKAGINGLKTGSGSPGLVTVTGFGKDDVILRTNKANVIQVRGSDGNIAAMLIRIKPNIWGFSKAGDEDWGEILSLYGVSDGATA